MEITSEMIKKLRDQTGAGMMDCKRALESTGGDMNAAIEYLRKKGAAVAQKRADRSAKEGAIVTRVSGDGKTGVIVEVNCETDFVARSEDFVGFATAVAQAIETEKPASLDRVAGLRTSTGKTVAELQNDLLAKVGEKIDVKRYAIYQAEGGSVGSYTHLGSKIGVLVEFTGLEGADAAGGAGRDVAMQVAAMNPMVVTRDQIDKSIIDREMEIYRTQAKNEGKPAQIVDKIAAGRLEKFYQEVCLIEQIFIKDSGKTIKEYLQETGTKAGKPVAVKRFVRFHLGEEVQ
jgi:elongation factor Ts